MDTLVTRGGAGAAMLQDMRQKAIPILSIITTRHTHIRHPPSVIQ